VQFVGAAPQLTRRPNEHRHLPPESRTIGN
jgi:hypothetical protein